MRMFAGKVAPISKTKTKKGKQTKLMSAGSLYEFPHGSIWKCSLSGSNASYEALRPHHLALLSRMIIFCLATWSIWWSSYIWWSYVDEIVLQQMIGGGWADDCDSVTRTRPSRALPFSTNNTLRTGLKNWAIYGTEQYMAMIKTSSSFTSTN